MTEHERNYEAEKAIILYLKSVSTRKQAGYYSVSEIAKGMQGLFDLKQVRVSLRDLQLNKYVKLWGFDYYLTSKAWEKNKK
jgi:hypothetical protein